MAEDLLRRLHVLERAVVASSEKIDAALLRLERRQSEIIGCLVGAKLWKVDERTGRSASPTSGHSDSRGGGSEGRGPDRTPARNPTVRQDPPRWTGEKYKGQRFSQTTSAYMTALASFIDWCADEADRVGECTSTGKPRAPFLLQDARVAREWVTELARREESEGYSR